MTARRPVCKSFVFMTHSLQEELPLYCTPLFWWQVGHTSTSMLLTFLSEIRRLLRETKKPTSRESAQQPR
jgi:hypothetical protein